MQMIQPQKTPINSSLLKRCCFSGRLEDIQRAKAEISLLLRNIWIYTSFLEQIFYLFLTHPADLILSPCQKSSYKENIRLKDDHISTETRTTITRSIESLQFDSANGVTLSALSVRKLLSSINTVLQFNFQDGLAAADSH